MKYNTGRMKEDKMLQENENKLYENRTGIVLASLIEELIQNENDNEDDDGLKSLCCLHGKDVLNGVNVIDWKRVHSVQAILSSKLNPDYFAEKYQYLITKVAEIEKDYEYDRVILVTNDPTLFSNSIKLNLYEMWKEKSPLISFFKNCISYC